MKYFFLEIDKRRHNLTNHTGYGELRRVYEICAAIPVCFSYFVGQYSLW
jgi:hypothetical protein